jgi:hypothetical protein
MPVPGMRHTQPQRRDLCETPVVGVPVSPLIGGIVDVIEKPDVRLFVECDLDDVVRAQLKLVVQIVHDRVKVSGRDATVEA